MSTGQLFNAYVVHKALCEMSFTQPIDPDNQPMIVYQMPQPIATSLTSISYNQTFVEISLQGKGGFGTVYKVMHKFTGQISAIKRIKIELKDSDANAKTLKEVENLVKVKSQYVVECYQSWPEPGFLFIQMEFCSQNLKDILKDKPQVFDRQKNDPLGCVEYFISCEIFRQILESVQYLHELEPPVIHRDLKPENILIAESVRNCRFVKLCDFGLATVHDKRIHSRITQKHTADVGDARYQAPENIQGLNYNHKSDIYSLALIGGELFDVVVLTIDENSIYKTSTQSNLSDTLAINNEPVDGPSTTEPFQAEDVLKMFIKKEPWECTTDVELKVIKASKLRSGDSRYFQMNSHPRGRAIIFATTDGLDVEILRWRSIFAQLDFKCEIYVDFSCSQIKDSLLGVSCQRLAADALFVMVIGGGFDQKIYGYGNREVDNEMSFTEIVDIFSANNPNYTLNRLVDEHGMNNHPQIILNSLDTTRDIYFNPDL
ncbi:unnamed protein product [Oppiella nova]|uniref:Protein kinase domain-containing protein n=1 Tax=Oppiella nova TaxID=334625 RepID=A0A7R9LL61_9ACAR|nr:unnamed protein product [Oppiella nova]CAG2164730.1 unnamed protein product [Oppiella nova]